MTHPQDAVRYLANLLWCAADNDGQEADYIGTAEIALNNLTPMIANSFWTANRALIKERDALRDVLDKAEADIADLQHDLARYMGIASEEATRAERAEADKAAAVEAERERCAAIADDYDGDGMNGGMDCHLGDAFQTRRDIAAAIRKAKP